MMRFKCMRSDLSSAVSNVSRAVSAKATIPALEGVLIKAYHNTLEISGYDLEIGIVTQMEATVAEFLTYILHRKGCQLAHDVDRDLARLVDIGAAGFL